MFDFDNSFARLPDQFYKRLDPTPVAAPKLIKLNVGLAKDLGLDPAALSGPEGVSVLAGNRVPDGSSPLAMAYAGHQFGSFNPQLGDGRAILLGEVTGPDAIRRDIQLKGSGLTPFSRSGDGRAAVGPVLREYIISEAMAALGIPTTRALAAVATGENVYRETILPGAVLTRVATGFVRVGSFEFFAVRQHTAAIRTLADYVIARHYPEARETANPYCALFEAVMARQAELIARWMLVGFIHGVMNTDNMALSGETIDYGPCAFVDTYHPNTVFSSIDYAGRYAYANQPRIAHWNLARLAQSLLPIMADDEDTAIERAQEAINQFPKIYQAHFLKGARAKLGLLDTHDADMDLADDLFTVMAADKLDFTNTFRKLCALTQPGSDLTTLDETPSDALQGWFVKWHQRLPVEPTTVADERTRLMRASNPAFIPRNHRVEEALAAAQNGDFAPFEQLVTVLSNPFDDQPAFSAYADPPRPDQIVPATFCGT